MSLLTVLQGDCLEKLRTLESESVQVCVTSPPYWGLRDYGHVDQLGLEKTPAEYVQKLVAVFLEVRRVLRKDGTLWLNLGASYFGGGNGGNPSQHKKQGTNRGSFSYDKRPNRSRSDVQACGSGGKELAGSMGSGRACPDCGGELTACSLNRHNHNSGTPQQSAQGEQRLSRKVHGSEHLDSSASFAPASRVGARLSTKVSSSESAPGASLPKDSASAFQSKRETFSGSGNRSEHKSACTVGTERIDRPLSGCMSDTAFVCMACGYSTRMSPPYKPKDLINIPFLVSEALRADGWYLRSDIIWAKPNCMPESVEDRPTRSHEYLFLLSKSPRYYYNAEAIKEPCSESFINDSRWETGPTPDNEKSGYAEAGAQNPKSVHRLFGSPKHKAYRGRYKDSGTYEGKNGEPEKQDGAVSIMRNKRDVWWISPAAYKEAHFATFPPKLIEPCILAGSKPGDVVFDCFAGSGTTGMVAIQNARKAVLIELNPDYCAMIERRCQVQIGLPIP